MKAALCCCFILAFPILGRCEGVAYQWVDDNGVTVFSAKPPIDGRASESRPLGRSKNPEEAPADDWKVVNERLRRRISDIRNTRNTREAQKAEQQRIEEAHRYNCKAAKSNLQKLRVTAMGYLYRDPEVDEEYRRIALKEREARIREAEARIAIDCKQQID